MPYALDARGRRPGWPPSARHCFWVSIIVNTVLADGLRNKCK